MTIVSLKKASYKKALKENERIIIALIIGLAIIGYALINQQTKLHTIREQSKTTLMKKSLEIEAENEKIEQTEKAERAKTRKFDDCIDNAHDNYKEQWLLNCDKFGQNIEKDDNGEITNCTYRTSISDKIEQEHTKAKEMCAELYK